MFFKRNQIEEAISRTIGERSALPSQALKIQIKRLLDLDRNSKRSPGSNDPELANYAFYDRDPPGRGTEVMFSESNTFALLMGVRLLDHGWPQSFVVSSLRKVRFELSEKQKSILETSLPANAPRKSVVGDLYLPFSHSAFLLVVSDDRTEEADQQGPYVRLFDTQEAGWTFQMERPGRSCSWFELDHANRTLHNHLLSALPRSRGRGA